MLHDSTSRPRTAYTPRIPIAAGAPATTAARGAAHASRARRGRIITALLLVTGGAGVTAVAAHELLHAHMPPPATSEFGLGPRTSANGKYRATLLTDRPLLVGPMQRVTLSIVDDSGRAVNGGSVTIDGGMPQHGHGLPTRPRVTATARAGAYEVAGLRFNMGGWWVLKFGITATAGTDSVTFNIRL